MSLEIHSTNVYIAELDANDNAKKRPADSLLDSSMCSEYNHPYSITIDDEELLDSTDDSALPTAKRQRKNEEECDKVCIFGEFGFIPIDNSSKENQQRKSETAGVDGRRRSSVFSVLSALSFFGAGPGEGSGADRRRSSVLSVLTSPSLFNELDMPEKGDLNSFSKEDAEDFFDISDHEIESLLGKGTDDDVASISSHDDADTEHHNDNDISSHSRIIPTELDVLFGRGQARNKHPGNERFRIIVDEMKPLYFAQGKSKKKKNAISKQVMESVFAYGGRFLEVANDTDKGATNDDTVFVVVDEKRARKKCSQRLRETKR